MAPNKTNVSTNVVEAVLESDVFLQKVASVVAEAVEAKLQAFIKDLQMQLNAKDKEVLELRQQLADRTDELEQYQRRNSLRIFGREETQNEDTDCIAIEVAKKIGVDLSLADIDRSHRVGPKVAGKKRPIIIKFVSYRKRREVFTAKRNLKGQGVTIREDLTKARMQVLRAAIDRFGEKDVWTQDGIIIAKRGNVRHRINSLTELDKIN